MYRLFKSRWFYPTHTVLGAGLRAAYVLLTGDWRLSPLASLGYPAIAFSMAWLLQLKAFREYPPLNRYLLYPEGDPTRPRPVSDDDWALKQAGYFRSFFRLRTFLSTPIEDGLICVPILVVGIYPLSAVLGGVVFGFLHLGRFTYLECMGKAFTYALVCLLILPSGVLTVALHMITNGIGFLVLEIARHRLSEKLGSNTSVSAAENAGGRGHE